MKVFMTVQETREDIGDSRDSAGRIPNLSPLRRWWGNVLDVEPGIKKIAGLRIVGERDFVWLWWGFVNLLTWKTLSSSLSPSEFSRGSSSSFVNISNLLLFQVPNCHQDEDFVTREVWKARDVDGRD
jgi:hypothetical protein